MSVRSSGSERLYFSILNEIFWFKYNVFSLKFKWNKILPQGVPTEYFGKNVRQESVEKPQFSFTSKFFHMWDSAGSSNGNFFFIFSLASHQNMNLKTQWVKIMLLWNILARIWVWRKSSVCNWYGFLHLDCNAFSFNRLRSKK